MSDLHQIREHFDDEQVEALFHEPKPEPRWLHFCRLHERALGDIAVLIVCFVVPLILWLLGAVG